jgi:hypothetical protein
MANNRKFRIERGSIQHLILLMITVSICGIIIYPIVDFFICSFIQHTKFIYTFKFYIVQPIVGGIVTALVIWAIDRKRR